MNIIARARQMIVNPKTEWMVIDAESDTMQSVLTKYVIPIALVGAACNFIGYGIIGINSSVLGIRRVGLDWGIRMAVLSFISGVLGILVTAFVVDALAPSFGSEKNINKSAQLAAYGFTPALLGSFFTLLPVIAGLGSLFGLYSIYLLYLGLGPVKNTPEDKRVIYLVLTIVAMIAVYLVIGMIIGSAVGVR